MRCSGRWCSGCRCLDIKLPSSSWWWSGGEIGGLVGRPMWWPDWWSGWQSSLGVQSVVRSVVGRLSGRKESSSTSWPGDSVSTVAVGGPIGRRWWSCRRSVRSVAVGGLVTSCFPAARSGCLRWSVRCPGGGPVIILIILFDIEIIIVILIINKVSSPKRITIEFIIIIINNNISIIIN